MKNTIEIPAQEASPYIKFDPNGELEIKGKSYDEDAISLYHMVLKKVEEFGASDKKDLKVKIYLKYFNTASSKCLYDLVSALKDMEDDGVNINMQWNYIEGDDSMKEEIEEFRENSGLDFEVLPERDFNDLGGR